MDWNLFWNAFGAIGTTVGSLITAIAVIVALKQYKQPMLKKIKIEFRTIYGNIDGKVDKYYYTINIKNKGIRICVINSIFLKGEKCNHFLNFIQVQSTLAVTLPHAIKEEESISFIMDKDNFISNLKELYKEGKISGGRMKIVIADSTGDEHSHRTKSKVKDIIMD